MKKNSVFKWRHYEPEIILLCVRWYLKYPLSCRQLEETIGERGLEVNHTTIYKWVQKYPPELEKRVRPHLKAIGKSWRVDETYIKIKGKWKYLYRASAIATEIRLILCLVPLEINKLHTGSLRKS